MTDNNHTLPHLLLVAQNGQRRKIVNDATGELIAEAHKHGEEIVSRCNLHDTLVEALRIIDKTCSSPFDSPTTAAIVCNIARDAVKKAQS